MIDLRPTWKVTWTARRCKQRAPSGRLHYIAKRTYRVESIDGTVVLPGTYDTREQAANAMCRQILDECLLLAKISEIF
jgi:hypothetical protein